MSYERVAVAAVLRWMGLAQHLLLSLTPSHEPRRNGLPRHYPYLRVVLFKLLCWTFFFAFASADCECGYSTTLDVAGDSGGTAVFTDLIESDFTTLTDLAQDTEWVRQAFNLTRERARGDYGEMFDVGNVVVHSSSARGDREKDVPGLGLIVKKDLVDGMVPVAEIDTQRLDLFWGTFRASMKMTNVPGTCAAFFWVGNYERSTLTSCPSLLINRLLLSYPVLQRHPGD